MSMEICSTNKRVNLLDKQTNRFKQTLRQHIFWIFSVHCLDKLLQVFTFSDKDQTSSDRLPTSMSSVSSSPSSSSMTGISQQLSCTLPRTMEFVREWDEPGNISPSAHKKRKQCHCYQIPKWPLPFCSSNLWATASCLCTTTHGNSEN